jgi:hypothetical protein
MPRSGAATAGLRERLSPYGPRTAGTAGAVGGARLGSSRQSRIAWVTSGGWIAASSRMRPPQRGLVVSTVEPRVFYPNGGSHSYTSIRTVDGRRMLALEFNASAGGADGLAHIYWQAVVEGTVASSGTTSVLPGSFIGFVRPEGIDELRIAAYFYPEDLEDRTDFSGSNRIAIDTVRVALLPRWGHH